MIGDLKHVVNRGVQKNEIFRDEDDYYRFVGNLYRLNNKEGALRVDGKKLFENPPPQNRLVEILKWGTIPNHYHLFLYEVVDGGVTEFTKRIGNAYTKYINIKYKQSGYVFQNSAKIISVEKSSHFLYIPFYVDLNPLDVLCPGWRQGNLDPQRALDLLKGYKWSSFNDYFGDSKFSFVTNKRLFFDLFDTNAKDYIEELKEFIREPFLKVGGVFDDLSTWQVDK